MIGSETDTERVYWVVRNVYLKIIQVNLSLFLSHSGWRQIEVPEAGFSYHTNIFFYVGKNTESTVETPACGAKIAAVPLPNVKRHPLDGHITHNVSGNAGRVKWKTGENMGERVLGQFYVLGRRIILL